MAKILIVDDDYSIRELFKFTFQEAGHTVTLAKNGLDAIEKLKTGVPDFMLLDISMPEMNGLEFVRAINQPDAPTQWRMIPFVIMTGENYMDVNLHYAFQKTPSCKSFMPKMEEREAILNMATEILRSEGKA